MEAGDVFENRGQDLVDEVGEVAGRFEEHGRRYK